jgi:hypothetical protein
MPPSTTLGVSTNLAGVAAAKMGPPLPEVIVRTLYEIKMCLQVIDNKRVIGGGGGSRTIRRVDNTQVIDSRNCHKG